jgi:hypothetical protein
MRLFSYKAHFERVQTHQRSAQRNVVQMVDNVTTRLSEEVRAGSLQGAITLICSPVQSQSRPNRQVLTRGGGTRCQMIG